MRTQFDFENSNYVLDVQGPKTALKELWTKNFEAQSAPFVYEGLLYICEDQTFHAIDPKTGNSIWEFKISGRATIPVFQNDLLIFGGNYIDNHVYALDKNTGKLIWKYNAGVSAPIHRSPVIQNDLLYLNAGKTIHCLTVLSGKKQWSFNLKKKAYHAGLVIIADRLYVATQDAVGKEEIQCIDMHKQELVWKIKTPHLRSNLICAEEYLFYLNTEGELCEVNLTTGEIIKSEVMNLGIRETNFHLTYNKGILIIGIGSTLVGLDMRTNPWSWKWYFQPRSSIGRPVVANDVIYFSTMGKGVFALDPISGDQLLHQQSEVRSDLACGLFDSNIFVAGSMSEKVLVAYSE